MIERKYQICTNCVMDTTDSKINFDENGVCDHCNTFYKEITLLEARRGRSRKTE